MYQKPKVIAEIGCNHKGDMGIAFELLDLAKECGADVAKFQKDIADSLREGKRPQEDLGMEGNKRLGCQCVIQKDTVKMTY